MIGRHIVFERSANATRVYKPVEKVIAGCFSVDEFRLQGLLKDHKSYTVVIFMEKEVK